MPPRRTRRSILGTLLGALALAAGAPSASWAQPSLAVRAGDGWRVWWRGDAAPERWAAGDPRLLDAVAWRPAGEGVAWAEVTLRGDGEAWRTRAVLVRVDPRRVRLRLDTAFAGSARRAGWRLDRAPRGARLAVNAGQFVDGWDGARPWGWVVLDGREWRPPGQGPLSTAIVVDSAGGVRFLRPDALARPDRARGVAFAFQSYPTLLAREGAVPPALRDTASGVDLEHRDARLAVGRLRDGALLIALTRFDALGGALDVAPFGLTTPEMAALMGALGCTDAVLLDGGISAQLLVGGPDGGRRWRGLRPVPLALVGVAP